MSGDVLLVMLQEAEWSWEINERAEATIKGRSDEGHSKGGNAGNGPETRLVIVFTVTYTEFQLAPQPASLFLCTSCPSQSLSSMALAQPCPGAKTNYTRQNERKYLASLF